MFTSELVLNLVPILVPVDQGTRSQTVNVSPRGPESQKPARPKAPRAISLISLEVPRMAGNPHLKGMQPLTLAACVAVIPDASAAHQDGIEFDELAVLGLVAQILALTVDGGDAELDLGQLGPPDEI